MQIPTERRQGRSNRSPRSAQGLTRTQVERTLAELGAWADQQVRPLLRDDLERLMEDNARSLAAAKTTGAYLPLAGIEFGQGIDLAGMNLEHADLSRAQLPYANFERASLLYVRLSGALLSHAVFRQAQLHDAELTAVWANNADFECAALYRAGISGADLRFCNFIGARMDDAILHGATLWRACLRDAKLYDADLRGADLWRVDLRDADLSGAQLDEANLKESDLRGAAFGHVVRESGVPVLATCENTRFDGAIWDPHYLCPEETRQRYQAAASVYRILKDAHHRAGLYDVSDQFAYREQLSLRKEAWHQKQWVSLVSRTLAELLFGYGYRWRRVVSAALALYLVFAGIYWLGGLFGERGLVALGQSLYFSAVSFTGLGYGPWVVDLPSQLKYLGAIEVPCGVFLMALFLATFTRRYMR